jgi:cytochrome c oxidase assembly factor CtaG
MRALALVCGLALIALAPLLPERSLSLHMVEHALVAAAAAPLIAFGAPTRGLEARVLRSRFVPVLAWALFVAAQWALHSGPALSAAEAGGAAHALEHAALIVTSLLFWLPVAAGARGPGRLGVGGVTVYLFSAMPAVDLAAVTLIARGEESAGASMLAGMLPIAIVAAWSFWRWAAGEERAGAGEEAFGDARG